MPKSRPSTTRRRWPNDNSPPRDPPPVLLPADASHRAARQGHLFIGHRDDSFDLGAAILANDQRDDLDAPVVPDDVADQQRIYHDIATVLLEHDPWTG